MLWYQVVFGVVLIVLSIAIVALVLLQEGNSKGLSGAIAGGAETFFGKNKGRTMEAKLVKLTKIVGIGFFVIALAAKIILSIF
ncbi:MAG: preprotein translocase subunit SecG [Clostridia bacterium]|nr:preprotein translocase subunit SecG [Clostridia bacterium]MBQ2964278.1 preprotein translocase subunit SecG [Clostridia bacterium]MBQ6932609.1 preprotein translocase subunit SecG [Clostridia bacterium]